MKANAIVGQSGGPTAVINTSLCGVIQQAAKDTSIQTLYGMRFGLEGLLSGNLIDLSRQNPIEIEKLKATPSSILCSSRYKLREDDFDRIKLALEKNNIRYFFTIGGNGSTETLRRIEQYCRDEGYELNVVGIPNTVGRQSGFLAAASALAKIGEKDAPHIICLPERPIQRDRFLGDVEQCLERLGWFYVVCGEGAVWKGGGLVSASVTSDRIDSREFGAMGGGSAALLLHRLIHQKIGLRSEFQITESLPMCSIDRASKIDLEEGYEYGAEAVRLAAKGLSGVMVSLERISNHPYRAVGVSCRKSQNKFQNQKQC